MLKQSPVVFMMALVALLCLAGCEKQDVAVEEAPAPEKRLKPNFTNAMCWIPGKTHSETGFFCSTDGKPYVVTSESALQSDSGFTIQSLDGLVWKSKRVFVSSATEAVMIELLEPPPGVTPVTTLRLPDPGVKPGDFVVALGVHHSGLAQRSAFLGSVGQDRINIGRISSEMPLGSMVAHLDSEKAVGIVLQQTWLSESTGNVRRDAAVLMSEPKLERFVQRLDRLAKWELLDWAGYQQREAALKQSLAEVQSLLGYLLGRKLDTANFNELHAARKRYAASAAIRDLSQSDRRDARSRLFRDVESLLRRAETRCSVGNWTVGQTVRRERVLRIVKAGLAIMDQTRKNIDLEDAFFHELY